MYLKVELVRISQSLKYCQSIIYIEENKMKCFHDMAAEYRELAAELENVTGKRVEVLRRKMKKLNAKMY